MSEGTDRSTTIEVGAQGARTKAATMLQEDGEGSVPTIYVA